MLTLSCRYWRGLHRSSPLVVLSIPPEIVLRHARIALTGRKGDVTSTPIGHATYDAAACGPRPLLLPFFVIAPQSRCIRMAGPPNITTVLEAVRGSDHAVVDELFKAVYDELQRIAQRQRSKWGGDDTLNTTALVHEAYVKLVKQKEVGLKDRAHFFAVAATAMRHILINYAERRVAAKRGGGIGHTSIEDANPVTEEAAEDVLALGAALDALGEMDPRQSRVVECRFFAGLSIPETAEALGVSTATVERDWAVARAWLRRALDDSTEARS
jgi:RNA polymerase sigma factor (TIGR02999 family)